MKTHKIIAVSFMLNEASMLGAVMVHVSVSNKSRNENATGEV